MVSAAQGGVARSSLRILIVDDELTLLQLMQKYVTRLGYQVEVCSRAREALARYAQDPGAFAVVVVDLFLPDLPGEDLVCELYRVHAGVRVLICSGYPFHPTKFSRELQAQIGFLQKPFLPKMLGEAIEKLLSHGRAAQA